MIRVLFVDDETSLLAGLRRMLYLMRGEWDMTFVSSGVDALNVLRNQPVDVIVTDMRMPEMDGAQLLACVREEFPEVVRVILSGFSELASMLRGLPVAHWFLGKPTSRDVLKAAIQRSSELQRRLSNPETRSVIGSISALPSPSATVAELNRLLAMPHPPTDEIANVLGSDIAMTVKLLQLANSAFFGISLPVTDVRQAVNYLGLSTIRDLVVASEIFEGVEPGDEVHTQTLNRIKEHSMAVGRLAGELMPDEEGRNEAFVSGMLHDVGELIVGIFMSEKYAEFQIRRNDTDSPEDLERELFGATHADIGAYLLELWGLPYSIVEAVARHHDAELLPGRTFDTVHAVYIAEALTDISLGRRELEIDMSYLEGLGIAQQVLAISDRLRGGD